MKRVWMLGELPIFLWQCVALAVEILWVRMRREQFGNWLGQLDNLIYAISFWLPLAWSGCYEELLRANG